MVLDHLLSRMPHQMTPVNILSLLRIKLVNLSALLNLPSSLKKKYVNQESWKNPNPPKLNKEKVSNLKYLPLVIHHPKSSGLKVIRLSNPKNSHGFKLKALMDT